MILSNDKYLFSTQLHILFGRIYLNTECLSGRKKVINIQMVIQRLLKNKEFVKDQKSMTTFLCETKLIK